MGEWGGDILRAMLRSLHFHLSFMKDAWYDNGTQDDVWVRISQNSVSRGLVGAEGAGWRDNGVYTVALILNQGDYVNTWIGSEVNKLRHLANYHFRVTSCASCDP